MNGKNSNRAAVVQFLTLTVACAVTTMAQEISPLTLSSGTVLIADSFGAVIGIDPASDSPVLVATNLVRPFGLAIDRDGTILVTDGGALEIVRIDPATGWQTVIPWGGGHGEPYGIAVEKAGTILVANAVNLTRVNPADGSQSIVSSNGYFSAPLGVAVDRKGRIYVADSGAGAVIRVNPKTGAQTLICSGLVNPCGIAIDAQGNLLVTEMGAQRVSRVFLKGKNKGLATVSEGGDFVTPVGIAVGAGGELFVSDPNALNLDGGVFQMDPTSGAQNDFYAGSGDFVNPSGLAILP